MTDGPLKQAFDLLDSDGVLSRTLTTYRKRNGMLVKETSTRQFMGSGDYNDSYTDEPLVRLED